MSKKVDKNVLLNMIAICGGILVNVICAYLTYKAEIPMYFDAIGTIGVAAVCGILPGFLVAVFTNLFCTLFNSFAVYYAIISVLMALATYVYVKRGYFKKKVRVLDYLLLLALISGGLGAVVQWLLLGHPQMIEVDQASEYIATKFGLNYYLCFVVINIILNLLDKSISAGIAVIVLKYIPVSNLGGLWDVGWQQRPLSAVELKRIKTASKEHSLRLQGKVTRMLVLTTVAMTLIMGVISIQLYYSNAKARYSCNATGAAKMAAHAIDGDKIDKYLGLGRQYEEYNEVESMLYEIRENYEGVEYLYVIKMTDEGCKFIFDLDADDVEAYQVGDVVEFEEAFKPYLDDLFAGKEIEPIESDDTWGWVLTKYIPVKDSNGDTVCYACADVKMNYVSDYLKDYIVKVILIFSGFFFVVLAYGIWLSRYLLVYPINSMAACTNDFMTGSDNQTVLDENVKKIKALDIHTGDEIENLYKALCTMTESTAEKMKDVRQQAKAINQMQTGLIITMADLVENRDSDTGYHILKTADYVKIILDGLQKKGYYSKKLTPKFIADVQMSAPLHDIGKINIPDAVLNKPGKLTDEEFEIMKTHTVAGKQIMEKAISTVKGESYLKEARNMAAYHHEKWDGSGYPEGVKGEVIPLSARIMAVADVFDALTAKRVYKDPMPFEKAMDIIVKESGKHFDPKCVEVFVESEKEVRRVLKKYQE